MNKKKKIVLTRTAKARKAYQKIARELLHDLVDRIAGDAEKEASTSDEYWCVIRHLFMDCIYEVSNNLKDPK